MKKLMTILFVLMMTLSATAFASEETNSSVDTFELTKPQFVQLYDNRNVIATYFVVNCREWITLRDIPSVYGESLARIPLGQAVGFIENVGNGFYKINYDGLVGYSLAQYLSPYRY